MFLSVLLWITFLIIFIGAISILIPLRFLRIRTRARGAQLAAIGVVVALIIVLMPASESRVATHTMRLDDIIPVYEFNEVHTLHVAAPPERVFDAARNVSADEIRFFKTLTAIRRCGRSGPENILNPPDKEPLLDVATRSGFRWLANEPPRELVVGVHVARDAFAAMNFFITPDGRGGSNVLTETRVHASTPRARRSFAVYWRIILLGSAIIRRMWLRAIEKRCM
jgi:hypothetical protein